VNRRRHFQDEAYLEPFTVARDAIPRLYEIEIVAEADQDLVTGIQDQKASANTLRLVAIVGGLIILIVVGGSVITALSYPGDMSGEVRVLMRRCGNDRAHCGDDQLIFVSGLRNG
jgi:uncharacterized membrane protein YgcG